MYTETNLVEKLNFYDVDCDTDKIRKLINELKIEPIYEDNNKELYYDEDAYEQLKSALEKQESPYETKEAEVVEKSEEKLDLPMTDSANKSVLVVAKTIAMQITDDLEKYIKNTEKLEEAFRAGAYKRDNEILSQKLQNIINDNKKLIEKIRALEADAAKYQRVFGNIYVKAK